ncbi:MAG: hypothetical protein RR705_00070 [Lachnospiraceae bacterium]
MMIMWIVLAFIAGIFCGFCILGLLNAKRANKLERYQQELDKYKAELDREKCRINEEWESPNSPQMEIEGEISPSYKRIVINK